MPSQNIFRSTLLADHLNFEHNEVNEGSSANLISQKIWLDSDCKFVKKCMFVLDGRPPATRSEAMVYGQTALELHKHFTDVSTRGCLCFDQTWLSSNCLSLHKYIYKAIRLCYETDDTGDYCSNGIGQSLILEILVCDEDLGPFFSILNKYPWPHSDEDILFPEGRSNMKRGLNAVQYYLRLILGTGIADIGTTLKGSIVESRNSNSLNCISCFTKSTLPLNEAASCTNSEAMLLLLQYGADPFISSFRTTSATDVPTKVENAFATLISSLNCLAFVKSKCVSTDAKECLQLEEERILLCLQHVHGVCYSLPVISSDSPHASNLWTTGNQPPNKLTVPSVFWSTLCEHGLVGLPSLQHTCRHLIRQKLATTSMLHLPDAISELPLPGKLKVYINLG